MEICAIWFAYSVVLFYICISSINAVIGSDKLIIQTINGKVKGQTQTSFTGKPVDIWYGIPYAEKPIGNLRFRPPIASRKWTNTLETINFPPACMQTLDTKFGNFSGAQIWVPKVPLSEDCLYINVAVPHPRPTNASVMVWIHGGGLYSGTNSLDRYDHKTLASEENVIVASMQYRLALFGFLYFGTSEVPGNVGLLDQALALHWIKNNIHAFGGNPDSITIFGESAGAASVSYHLLSPLSRNSFSRAIMQSGSATAPWASISNDKSIIRGLQLAKVAGCPCDPQQLNSVIQCLKHSDAKDLMEAEADVSLNYVVDFAFHPVVDGNFITRDPLAYLKTGNVKKADILIGATKDEGYYFLFYYLPNLIKIEEDVTVSRQAFFKSVPQLAPRSLMEIEAIIFEYTAWANPNNATSNRDALDKMVGDYYFTCDVNEFASYYAAHNNKVFLYYYKHASPLHHWPLWAGSMHGDEIEIIFGDPLNPVRNYTAEQINFSRQMMRYWTNFAKTGNPNELSSELLKEKWPLFKQNERAYINLDVKDFSISKGGLRPRQCAFWKEYIPKLKRWY